MTSGPCGWSKGIWINGLMSPQLGNIMDTICHQFLELFTSFRIPGWSKLSSEYIVSILDLYLKLAFFFKWAFIYLIIASAFTIRQIWWFNASLHKGNCWHVFLGTIKCGQEDRQSQQEVCVDYKKLRLGVLLSPKY